jgi:hypothetical protein
MGINHIISTNESQNQLKRDDLTEKLFPLLGETRQIKRLVGSLSVEERELEQVWRIADMTKSGPRLTTVAIHPNYLPRRFLMTPAQRDISRKLRIFNYAKQIGNVSAACRHFGISREIYYQWKRAY